MASAKHITPGCDADHVTGQPLENAVNLPTQCGKIKL